MKFALIKYLFSLVFVVNAQNTDFLVNTCKPENPRAKRGIVFFLTLDQQSFAKERARLGLENIPPEQVKHVANEENCKKLNAISESSNDWEIDLTNRDKFFYRTDDFFFILYQRKSIGTGYTPLIVFDKDFNLLDKLNI